jgi:hypothetical protein
MEKLSPFHPKLFAVIALILAFPPVFTNFGMHEGLRLSLSLFIFYVIRGIISLVLDLVDRDQSRFHLARQVLKWIRLS